MSTPRDRQSKAPRKLAYKPRLSGPERRAHILAVALDAFAAAGYEQTSMSTIATGTQVTKAVLYRYFPSKPALYVAVLDAQARQLNEYVSSRLPTAGDASARIMAAASAYLEFAERYPETWALLLDRTATDPECLAGRDRVYAATIGTALTVLAEDVAKLGFDPTQPRTQMAMRFVSTGLNGVIEWWREHPDISREQILTDLTALIATLADISAPGAK